MLSPASLYQFRIPDVQVPVNVDVLPEQIEDGDAANSVGSDGGSAVRKLFKVDNI